MSLAKEDEEFVVKVSLEMAEYLVSDRSVTQLQDLAEKFSEYEFVGISDLDGESVVGEQFVEFYPDADSVTRTVVENFYEIKQ